MKLLAFLLLCSSVLPGAQRTEQIFDAAVRALTAGDYISAESGFQSVLLAEPKQVAALSNLGIVYSRTNRPDRAIQVYERALTISPDEKAILLNLGLAYLKQESHGKALPLFSHVLALDPGNLQARQLEAVCQVYTGQLDPAIQELEALRKAAPHDAETLFLLAFAYLKKQDGAKAKTTFEQMFQAAGPARAQFLTAKAYYEAALFPQAEEGFREVLRLDSNFPGVHLELGKVYISLRRTDDAVRELEKALEPLGSDGEANYFLGGLLVQDGRFEKGVPFLERALVAKPDSWATYFYLGKAKLRLQQPADAVRLLQRAVQLNPEEANAYYLLGQALRAVGRDGEAREALKKVRDLKAAELESVRLDGGVAGAR